MYNNAEIWSSRTLLSIWIVQITFQIISIIALTILLAYESGTLNSIPASDIIFLVCLIITLVSGPMEMVFQSLKFLEPTLYCLLQAFKLLFATLFFGDELYRYLVLDERRLFPIDATSLLSWALVANTVLASLLTISFGWSLTYGIKIRKRHRKEDPRDPEKR